MSGIMVIPLRNLGRRLGAAAWVMAVLLSGGCASPNGGDGRPPPAAISRFDADRYLGRWHEVARLPNAFQSDCAGDVTADYARASDGLIRVTNSCRGRDGGTATADGWARPASGVDSGKLEVTFVDLFGRPIWLAAGDYWVIGLDRHYRWAIVGAPERDYGWILAREPMLDRPTLVYIGRLVAEKGYDPCAFVLSETAMAPEPLRLCAP